MTQKFKYDVFISYSSKDKNTVHALTERLNRDRLRVWLDDWIIKPGDSITEKIQQGLEQSRTLILCMSPAFFVSEWSKLEHNTLLFRDPTNTQRRFIPILIADCNIPYIIAQFAYIDWRTTSVKNYNILLNACQEEEPEKAKPAVQEKPVAQEHMTLKGHTAGVTGVAITPDGKTVVSSSKDRMLKVWDLATGLCQATLKGHTNEVTSVAITPDGKTVVSSSRDKMLKVWDMATGSCKATLEQHIAGVTDVAITPDGDTAVSASEDKTLKVWDLRIGLWDCTLKGHSARVTGVAIAPDGRTVVSASEDQTLKTWDLSTGHSRTTLKGHTARVTGVVINTLDGKTVISSSEDRTLKVWGLTTGSLEATFEGHTTKITGVAITPDGRTTVSTSKDKTLKVWDMSTGHCLDTLEGHTEAITGVAITPDGKTVVSASEDKTLKVWDLESRLIIKVGETVRYTNAKVVLVGETGVGKTGLALRLCTNHWEPTESTHGMIVYRLELPADTRTERMEREVWLWDFAGQPDYRLIHQLYMDETALGVIVFDPQDDNPFDSIGYWEKALRSVTGREPTILLAAARCDRGGITISNKRFNEYIKERDLVGYLITGAKTGEGCEELKDFILRHIPWGKLPWIATSQLFKKLKDAIINLIEEDTPIVRLTELRQRLQLMMPKETITELNLRAVVALMQGQGMVQLLSFGDFVLLQPDWINRYASVVVRMAREHIDEMGVVPEHQVLDGRLDYKDMKRMTAADEKILLRAMLQTFLERSLCLRQETPQGTMLVFPSYFRRDKPDLPGHPNILVTYSFSGPLDEIYATLVVNLSYSDVFTIEQLWKNAADFRTLGNKRVGLSMTKKAEGMAEIVAYFDKGVPEETKVTFIRYIHEQLLARASSPEEVSRVRTYVCPNCNEPLENRRAIHIRLSKGLTDMGCPVCDERVTLVDLIEEKFTSDESLIKVRELDENARINLDNESRELILVGHATAIAAEAGQIFRPVPWADWGIDGEIEFKNDKQEASGSRVYIQLKSGDSYLYERKRDDVEVFNIKEPRHAEYWMSQAYPVMLVIRTSDGNIRWMNVTDYLRKYGKDTKHIVFKGEPFTAPNIIKLRNLILSESD